MKLLIDTLWAAQGAERLPPKARKLMSTPENGLLFSVASLWKIVIKNGLVRDDFKVNPRLLRRGLLDNGYVEIGIASAHVIVIDSLPPLHKYPLDHRLLVAQAIVGGVMSMTSDACVARYPCTVLHV